MTTIRVERCKFCLWGVRVPAHRSPEEIRKTLGLVHLVTCHPERLEQATLGAQVSARRYVAEIHQKFPDIYELCRHLKPGICVHEGECRGNSTDAVARP